MSKSSLSLSDSRKQYFILVLVAGCLIGVVGFGPRSALGLFLPPMSAANSWGRDVFALALAIQVSDLGRRTAAGGRAGRPLRRRAGDERRRDPVCRRSHADGAIDDAGDAQSLGGLHRRLRHRRNLVHAGTCLLRQAAAGKLAIARLRRRHRGGLVRPVPVLAARGRADSGLRLAERAVHLQRDRAAHHSALAGARRATDRNRVDARRPRRSNR